MLLLFIDLFLLHKEDKEITLNQALKETLIWISIGLGFGFFLWFYLKANEIQDYQDRVLEYYSAYLTEYALSVDNIFVIILIFRYFKVSRSYYHKVLFWGILGAILSRAFFIFVGAYMVHHFHYILYFFGAFLLYSGTKIFFEKEEVGEIDPSQNLLFRFVQRFLPIAPTQERGKFWIRKNGKLYFTTLFLVLLLVESTDIVFAIDSIPAAFAISQDEIVIYTSNILAVLGLRSMFFLLANILHHFHLLSKGLGIILNFVGFKMLLGLVHEMGGPLIKIPTYLSLIVIICCLGGSILLSLLIPSSQTKSKTTMQQSPTRIPKS
jgi:tellurite resistance protein TerC